MSTVEHFDAPRTDLVRMVKGEIRSDGDRRTLVGYAAMFNRSTVINSWEGNFREQIAPGAFARSIKNKGTGIKVLFNHGMDPSIGDKPLGRASTIQEDAKGLYVEVPLSRTSYNDDIIALLEDGAIDGMSFRFNVPAGGDSWEYPDKGLPTRTLREVNLSVTFPAYAATSAGVRSRDEFSIWRSLPEPTQAELFRIITSATRSTSPALGTDMDWPGSPDTQDPGSTHSSVITNEAALAAIETLRSAIK
jgi:HK97 family phage prohead protease